VEPRKGVVKTQTLRSDDPGADEVRETAPGPCRLVAVDSVTVELREQVGDQGRHVIPIAHWPDVGWLQCRMRDGPQREQQRARQPPRAVPVAQQDDVQVVISHEVEDQDVTGDAVDVGHGGSPTGFVRERRKSSRRREGQVVDGHVYLSRSA